DAGTNQAAPGEVVSSVDLDGLPRVMDGNGDGTAAADLGAYEFIVPDADGDGLPNAQDCAPFVSSVQTPPGPVGPTRRVVARGASGWLARRDCAKSRIRCSRAPPRSPTVTATRCSTSTTTARLPPTAPRPTRTGMASATPATTASPWPTRIRSTPTPTGSAI